MSGPAIAGVILSAGASRRMGSTKALLDFRGETFLDHLIGIFAPVCFPVIVVLGHSSDGILREIRRGSDARFVVNPDPDRGMTSSLQCGLRAVPETAEGAVFTLVDIPNVQQATVATVVRALANGREPVTIPRYAGERGHPVGMSRQVMNEILGLPATSQARDVIRSYRAQTRFIEVDDAGIIDDVDSPEDYQRLRRQWAPAGVS